MLWFWRPRKERTWRYTVRLAVRAWCFMNGLGLRPRTGDTQQEADRKRACPTYRYGDARSFPERPRGLKIAYKRGPGIRFLNPTPTRRKHLLLGWLPEFQHEPGPARKPKRVRRVGPEGQDSCPAIRTVDPHLRRDDIAELDSRPTPSRGQAPSGNGIAGAEPPFHTVIPAQGGIQKFSHSLAGEFWLPPLEGGTKNLVQTKLECAAQSITCQDSANPWGQGSPEAVIAPLDDVGATLVVGPDWEGTRPGSVPTATAPPSSCDVTFAEEEPWIMDPDDDESEVLEASQALIEVQWSKWRRAITELKPSRELASGSRRENSIP